MRASRMVPFSVSSTHQEASAAKTLVALCHLVNELLQLEKRATPTLAEEALPPVAQGNRGALWVPVAC